MNATVDTPHPEPSQAERLLAEFGDRWDIWREVLPGGRHGDWCAETLPGAPAHCLMRAATVEELGARLREAEA